MMDLNNRSVIITGGCSGLGKATATLLANEGAKVTLLDVKQDEAFAKTINGTFIQCDVTDEPQVKQAIKHAANEAPLACVVNCAGILDGMRIVGKEGPHDLARFARVIQVNLIGTFNVMRIAADIMSKQDVLSDDGERGVIINTASVAAFEGQIGQAAYSASKGGVAAMTLPAAREFTRFGIRVVTIAPGLFETPMMGEMSEKVVQSLQAHVQFPNRLGRGDEYAQLVHSIINNPMLNGCTIRLDGAVRLMPQ